MSTEAKRMTRRRPRIIDLGMTRRPRIIDLTDELISGTTFGDRLAEFKAQVTTALNGKAEDKGYSAGGDSGGRPMLDAVALVVGEGTHPAGEILYKLARYRAKRNPEDLVKVAAWAFLMWDQHMRKVTSEGTEVTQG